ncbi:hypothetical protein EG328_011354 [Venturia inaequalis]|uniref:Fatty acid hydroxylase domain-containing protein n=1 Tax=Venturia inaequalis TaxID=5025 RepID=A0A8H3V656_VENIN|nr:hypothetical protein EG328_011354 [Venturia inaequalis]RDI81226.1 Tripeptidyl-peptidase [Venturia inaequalis]
MGAAISLPLLSFFALPAFTSYGTSMNLLFFTLNWYILLLTHPPLQVEIIGISLVQFLLYLLPGLLFLGLDAGVPSVASAVKTQGHLSLPVRGGKGARKRVAKVVGWSIFNVALGVALLGGLETVLTKVLLTRHALSLSKTMPMPYAILKSVALLLAIRGTLQYPMHRYILHSPRSPFTALHMAWQHTLPVPFTLAATYDHPICYLIHHWVPLYLPAIALRVHILPFLLALSIATLADTVSYSGYSTALLPSGIILPGMAHRVEGHFLSKGEGNFSSFGLVDWVGGTGVGSDLLDDMKAEWAKRDGSGKLLEAGDNAGNLIGGVGEKMRGKAGAKKARKN